MEHYKDFGSEVLGRAQQGGGSGGGAMGLNPPGAISTASIPEQMSALQEEIAQTEQTVMHLVERIGPVVNEAIVKQRLQQGNAVAGQPAPEPIRAAMHLRLRECRFRLQTLRTTVGVIIDALEL